jgi:hypothetical protein
VHIIGNVQKGFAVRVTVQMFEINCIFFNHAGIQLNSIELFISYGCKYLKVASHASKLRLYGPVTVDHFERKLMANGCSQN